MKVELIIARGLTLMIDGEKPTETWSLGDNEEGTGYDIKDAKIGPHIVTNIDLHVSTEFEGDDRPTDLTLTTTTGTYELKVTEFIYGTEVEKIITMGDGSKHTMDETMIYIKAETT